MVEFKISEQNKKVYVAEKRSETTINKYEFEKTNKGWYVKKFLYHVNEEFPEVFDMYLPNELVEQILMVESIKDKLIDN